MTDDIERQPLTEPTRTESLMTHYLYDIAWSLRLLLDMWEDQDER